MAKIKSSALVAALLACLLALSACGGGPPKFEGAWTQIGEGSSISHYVIKKVEGGYVFTSRTYSLKMDMRDRQNLPHTNHAKYYWHPFTVCTDYPAAAEGNVLKTLDANHPKTVEALRRSVAPLDIAFTYNAKDDTLQTGDPADSKSLRIYKRDDGKYVEERMEKAEKGVVAGTKAQYPQAVITINGLPDTEKPWKQKQGK